MHVKSLEVCGYKGINAPFEICFNEGLNVIVGENASGKTTIVDALRLLLREDEFGFTPITDSDFHCPTVGEPIPAAAINIKAIIALPKKSEQVAFLPWSDLNGGASLTLQIENKEKNGRFKRHVWGGASRSAAFEWELFDYINCVYLPPLRDAEAKLREGKTSRLARLLKNLQSEQLKQAKKEGIPHPLEAKVRKFNNDLANDDKDAVSKANQKIKEKLLEAIGSTLGQDTQIQFSEVSFNRIVESLRLLFFPDTEGPDQTKNQSHRTLEQNSLGYNNLLYLATVLAELTDIQDGEIGLRMLLIEEPEAHLHPQLQSRLLKYLGKVAREKKVQIVVTTHSTVLASSAPLSSVIHLAPNGSTITATPLNKCGLDDKSSQFIDRWLDLTKATLLFAKGIILVEGIAEAFLLPVFAEKVLREYRDKHGDNAAKIPTSLEDGGISVINMNGIYFRHFMQLFCNLEGTPEGSANIPIRCSGITDNDPPKKTTIETDGVNAGDPPISKKVPIKPTPSKRVQGENHALKLVSQINKSDFCRLYESPLKTLEYDLAFEGNNLKVMAEVLHSIWPTKGPTEKSLAAYKDKNWEITEDKGRPTKEQEIASAAHDVLGWIENSEVGKGYFAQRLAAEVKNGADFSIPEYIQKAILWACGADLDGS